MWDPKTMFQDRTPLPLLDAPRPESERPVVTISDRVVLVLASLLQPTRCDARRTFAKRATRLRRRWCIIWITISGRWPV